MRFLFALTCLSAAVVVAQGCSDGPESVTFSNGVRRSFGNGVGLVWDDTLASSAQAWANTLVVGNECTAAYDNTTENGQNVHVRSTFSNTVNTRDACTQAARAWVSRGSQYLFTETPYTDNLPRMGTVLDFVNIVWLATRRVGCGSRLSNNRRCMVVVCEYDVSPTATDEAFLANVLEAGQLPVPEDDDLTPVIDGTVYIQHQPSKFCVDIPGGKPDSGTPLWVWTCSTTNDQVFVIKKGEGDFYYIQERSGARCWTMRESGSLLSSSVIMETCNQQANQQWRIRASTTSVTDPKTFEIQGANSGEGLCAVTNDSFLGSFIQTGTCSFSISTTGFQIQIVR